MTGKGSLVVVGTGIQGIRHATFEVIHEIQNAEKVLYLVADTITAQWLQELNSTAESLSPSYIEGRQRQAIYDEWVERILLFVRSGLRVCVAFYGHPGIFVFSGHESIRRAVMLPSISAQDCLFADLGFDPRHGFQSYEATDFLVSKRLVENRISLILWQIGVLGQFDYRKEYSLNGLSLLSDVLQKYYGSEHEVIVYEASAFPVCKPRIETVSLAHLAKVQVSVRSTLYVPPVGEVEINQDLSSQLKKLTSYSQEKKTV